MLCQDAESEGLSPNLWVSWNTPDALGIGEVPSIQKPQPKSMEQGRTLYLLSWSKGLKHTSQASGGWGSLG